MSCRVEGNCINSFTLREIDIVHLVKRVRFIGELIDLSLIHISWLHFLQFRYSYQHRINNSDRFVYNWDKKAEDFAPDYDEDASNCFENQYSNHLFNLAIRTSRKKYNYNIGADFEPQKSVSHSLLEKKESLEEPLEKSVFNVSPTVNFRYKFSKRTRLQIVYRGKSRQPNIRDLQPITDRTNPLNIKVGNPSLDVYKRQP